MCQEKRDTDRPEGWHWLFSGLAGTRQAYAAGAIGATGHGLPGRFRTCGAELAGQWLPGEGMSRRERPGAARPVRDPRRRRPR